VILILPCTLLLIVILFLQRKANGVEGIIEIENPNRQKKESKDLPELIQSQKCEITESEWCDRKR